MGTFVTGSPEAAAGYIRRGGIVAFPTETVYGLGADVFNERAVAAIFEAKKRPADNPLIAHIADIGQMSDLATEVTANARLFVEAFFPGPLTIVLHKSERVPLIATAGLDTIGIRMPGFELSRRFLKECGTPVVAPSANLSGRPSPTTWQAVFEDLDGRIDCILQGDATEIGLESTVVDCTGEVPVVLRSGSITIAELRRVVPSTIVADGSDTDAPRSPGMKHRHYSPSASVEIVSNAADAIPGDRTAFIGLDRPNGNFAVVLICADVDEYARGIFEFLRECDRRGIEKVYCQSVADEGLGTALMDRVRRAAMG
ncbi:MAG: threonylcarbamoyl-AMP synthase [Pyrinomonadaceae bacterium]|nr:threonylcarbamoyl-AMP synthase [Pyrinomonadaceae bacterium]